TRVATPDQEAVPSRWGPLGAAGAAPATLRTIASIPARTAAGRTGQAAMRAARAGSGGAAGEPWLVKSAESAPHCAPPIPERTAFPAESGGCANPPAPTFPFLAVGEFVRHRPEISGIARQCDRFCDVSFVVRRSQIPTDSVPFCAVLC